MTTIVRDLPSPLTVVNDLHYCLPLPCHATTASNHHLHNIWRPQPLIYKSLRDFCRWWRHAGYHYQLPTPPSTFIFPANRQPSPSSINFDNHQFSKAQTQFHYVLSVRVSSDYPENLVDTRITHLELQTLIF